MQLFEEVGKGADSPGKAVLALSTERKIYIFFTLSKKQLVFGQENIL